MIRFPIKCEVKATAAEGIGKTWKSQSRSLPPIISAIPPELLGPGGGYSPEDFFALALLNCIIAGFKVSCEKFNLSFQNLEARAILTVDQIPSENVIWMKHIEVFIDITGASDQEQVQLQLEKSIKNCAVSNSIKSGTTFHLKVSNSQE
jgi:uncharacterized OsmC-like protein